MGPGGPSSSELPITDERLIPGFDVPRLAQDCAAFIELRRIAEWVGDGKGRPVVKPAGPSR
jgi:hypothetical protein